MKKGNAKTNDTIILFLKGKARSGKDTFANLIKEEVEKGNTPFKSVAILAFADWLKDICRRNHFYENKLEDRDVLIQIGDEMRCIDPDIFAKPVADAVKVFSRMRYDLVIITDLRYKNEFDFVHNRIDLKTFILEIESPNQLEGVSEYAIKHPTENLVLSPNFKLSLPYIEASSIEEIRKIANCFISFLDSWKKS